MLTNSDTKHWGPLPQFTQLIGSLIAPGMSVLEVGPGDTPLPQATHFIDRKMRFAAEHTFELDVNFEPLPFADNAFDFVYCRHLLEDIYDPFFLCREMSRVGKRGYVETPSPLAELCRGIDGQSPSWRGYHHHRYIIWVADDELRFITKFPIVETLGQIDDTAIANLLRQEPIIWNSYCFWEDEISFRHLEHNIDFNVDQNYAEAVVQSINQGMANGQAIKALLTDPA